MITLTCQTFQKANTRLSKLYGPHNPRLLERFRFLLGRYGVGAYELPPMKTWDEKDAILITYADMVQHPNEAPLHTLNQFCKKYLKKSISTIHILPFYPASSDGGFSVIDYRSVEPSYGNWEDIGRIDQNFRLMFDLVLNHCSWSSNWFKDYLAGITPESDYFIEVDPKTDLSLVTRPRTTPLLTKAFKKNSNKWVWTTFSADQVDVNWKNPDVLFEFLDIFLFYLSKGARFIRLDAIAFIWKEIGTTCLHLPEVHEILKLFRIVVDAVAPQAVIITETNVPQDENLSYFGKGDEAHMVYNFSFSPLILQGFHSGSSKYLNQWASKLPKLHLGNTFFNFTSTHDGIGIRPLVGLIPDEEINFFVKRIEANGGYVSYKTNTDGSISPYELNTTYYEALKIGQEDPLQTDRYLCAHAMMFSFQGIPGVYFHCLTASLNNHAGVKKTNHYRDVNRYKFGLNELETLLEDSDLHHKYVFETLINWLKVRGEQAAFHPDNGLIVHELGAELFCFTRPSFEESSAIVCVFNMTAEKQKTRPLPLADKTSFTDLLTGKKHTSKTKQITLQPYQAVWLK